jgi:excisionase family DNA binding protein
LQGAGLPIKFTALYFTPLPISSCPEAAEYMGVTPWFVEVKIRSGELPALKLCRHYTILKQDMDAFLDRHRAALLDKHRSTLTQSAKDAA